MKGENVSIFFQFGSGIYPEFELSVKIKSECS